MTRSPVPMRFATIPSPTGLGCRLALALLLAMAGARAAETLVDFNVANGTGADSYQGPSRAWTVGPTPQYARMNFDTQTPLFPANGQPPLYGGAVVSNAASAGTVADWRFHDNNPPGWPNAPRVALFTSSDGGVNNDVLLAYVFKRADFAGAPAKVAFDATSTLDVNVPDWQGGGGWSSCIRFLVCDSGQYYVSEAALTGAGTLSLSDFDNNAASGKRWAPVTLTATSFRLPASPSFQAVDFTDVSEVGWIGEGSSGWFRFWSFTTFQMAGTVVRDPGFALSAQALTVSEQGTNAFTVVLGSPPTGAAVLDVQSSNASEATVSPAQLTFTGANWNTPQTVVVSGVDNSTLGANAPLDVMVSVNASETTATEYLSLAAQTVAVTLVNDDFMFVVAYRGEEMLVASGVSSSVSVSPDAGSWPPGDEPTPLVRIDFTTDPIYNNANYSQGRVFGGLEVVEAILSQDASSFNNDSIWSGYAKSYCLRAGDSDTSAPGRIRGVLLWAKSDFQHGMDRRLVSMGAGDWMSVRLLSDLDMHDGTQQTDGVRFVVKDAGTYYYSKTQLRGTGAPFAAGTYRLNDVGGEQWAVWDPAANPSTFTAGNVLPGGGTFATRQFRDVQAVGLSFDCAKAQWASLLRFDEFLATGLDATPRGTAFVLR